ncbi:hypothetical protein D3C86_1459830 [compost metagenome]
MRPSITPSSSTIRLFSSKMMSAASFEISTAESTEMPTSAARRAGASLMPSPMKPTVSPCARRLRTMRSLCAGVSRANTLARRTATASCASSMASMSAPRYTWRTSKPTSRQTFCVTSSTSPVSTLTSMPDAFSAARAGAVDSLGGSRKAM